ncbi:hypothetical protein ACIBF6_13630 [Streptosporangium amethystogenes]|uniref:hypothetical protein n=1 Tax=Streptosporangium amethystogenes TaxID=2002 RepID=UPI003790BDDA
MFAPLSAARQRLSRIYGRTGTRLPNRSEAGNGRPEATAEFDGASEQLTQPPWNAEGALPIGLIEEQEPAVEPPSPAGDPPSEFPRGDLQATATRPSRDLSSSSGTDITGSVSAKSYSSASPIGPLNIFLGAVMITTGSTERAASSIPARISCPVGDFLNGRLICLRLLGKYIMVVAK